jgi:hypothetical protein
LSVLELKKEKSKTVQLSLHSTDTMHLLMQVQILATVPTTDTEILSVHKLNIVTAVKI